MARTDFRAALAASECLCKLVPERRLQAAFRGRAAAQSGAMPAGVVQEPGRLISDRAGTSAFSRALRIVKRSLLRRRHWGY
jgi:hypothetical protein